MKRRKPKELKKDISKIDFNEIYYVKFRENPEEEYAQILIIDRADTLQDYLKRNCINIRFSFHLKVDGEYDLTNIFVEKNEVEPLEHIMKDAVNFIKTKFDDYDIYKEKLFKEVISHSN